MGEEVKQTKRERWLEWRKRLDAATTITPETEFLCAEASDEPPGLPAVLYRPTPESNE